MKINILCRPAHWKQPFKYFRGYGKHFALTLTPTLRKKVMKLLDKEKIEYDKFSRKFLFIGKDGGKAPISMKDQKSILSKIEKEIGKDNFNYTFQKEDVEFDNLEEEVMTLKTKDAVMGLKVYNGAKGLGLKAALLGKYVRVKGSKKQVNDFGRTVMALLERDFGKAPLQEALRAPLSGSPALAKAFR